MMKKVKWIVLGYVFAILIHGCDSIVGSSNGSTISDLEYGDYGTVSWKPLYVNAFLKRLSTILEGSSTPGSRGLGIFESKLS